MKKISTNCYHGEPITNIMDIYRLESESKSVYHRVIGMKPAAVYLSMQTRLIVKFILAGELFYVHKS